MAVGVLPIAFLFSENMDAAKIVSSAVLGMDFRTVIVNGKSYVIMPPTIYKLAGLGYYLSDFGKVDTVGDIFKSLKGLGNASKALSFLIQGDESLADELSGGTLDEVVGALEEGFTLVSAANFCRLSALAKNVGSLTAKQKR